MRAAGDAACVDRYFSACALAWLALREPSSEATDSAARIYNQSLERLLAAATHFHRFHPARGLSIDKGGELLTVSVVIDGFPWQAADFQGLWPTPRGHEKLLTRRYACGGLGYPVVIGRCRNDDDAVERRFYPEQSFFAATAVLRFPDDPADSGQAAILEFHNPLAAPPNSVAGCSLPLAKDLTAPLAVTLQYAQRSYFAGFIEPGRASTTARLNFLEPYQPGKRPVVLIHGLYSDPLSWADMTNDLRAAPRFAERYQLWVFRYPTGQGFLQSAGRLRTELQAAITALDPAGCDPALKQITLVGHSMGGLIAKLQVTYSDDLVWSRLANRPLEEINTTSETRAFLAENCFFTPSPNVRRVIFIASPHCGSTQSSGLIGRSASLLVQPPPQQATMHQQLLGDNPDTFNPLFERRFPTSIDMLSPNSPLLAAMRSMRLADCVSLHNIIAVSHPVSLDGPTDGVVSVHSASHPNCDSVLTINSPHTKAHCSLQSSHEILRILACDSP